jgi:hypothetical protein
VHDKTHVAKTDGFRITVAPSPAGVGFEIFILDKQTGQRHESRRIFLDREEAKVIAFDEMQEAKVRRDASA